MKTRAAGIMTTVMILTACGKDAPEITAPAVYQIPQPILITVRTETMRPCIDDYRQPPQKSRAQAGTPIDRAAAAVVGELLERRHWDDYARDLLDACKSQ